MTFPLPPREAAFIAELIRQLDGRLIEEDKVDRNGRKDGSFFEANLVPVGVDIHELHGLERLQAAQEAHAEDMRLWDEGEDDKAAA